MAITFEQKKDISKSLIAVVVIMFLLAAIGFFVWKIYWQEPVELDTISSSEIQLEYRILNDDRIVSLELFPQIPVANETSIGKMNPFAEADATSTEEIGGEAGTVTLQPAAKPAANK